MESVTVAVDATDAVVDTVGPGGLLVAHHPLLLRGVDTVAASTPKGALIHRLIRGGAALFTAHTNADAATPGVSDALAEVLGLTVECRAGPGRRRPGAGQVGDIRPGRGRRGAARGAVRRGRRPYRRLLALQLERHRHRPVPARPSASPAIGTRGEIERVAEQRVEVIARAGIRAAVLAAMRAAHPYQEPAFDVFSLAPLPTGTGIGRIGSLARPVRFADFVAQVGSVLPQTTWGVRGAGNPDAMVTRVAVCGGSGDSLLSAAAAAGVQAYVTADLRHHPADEHRRRSDVGLVDIAHWASEYPWCAQAAGVLRSHFGGASGRGVPPAHRPVEYRIHREAIMKADAWQQRSLLELVGVDAELTRLAHRATHLPEQQRFEQVQAERQAVADRLAVLGIAWRTWTDRWPSWSRRSTPSASARTATAAY